MVLLNKIFFDYYESVFAYTKKIKPLSFMEVLTLDRIIGGNDYHKKIYDEPVFSLIREKNIKIAERTYFEAVFSDMANNTAKEAQNLLCKLANRKRNFYVLELGTGSGSQTLAFARRGLKVFTIEEDKTIFKWTKENFKKLQTKLAIDKLIFFHNAEFEEILGTKNSNKILKTFSNKIDLIYADPPWKGHYYKHLDEDFQWEYMSPNGKEIIARCINKALLTCIKLPINMPIESIYDLATKMNLSALVIDQEVKAGRRILKERVVFFTRNSINKHRALEFKHNLL